MFAILEPFSINSKMAGLETYAESMGMPVVVTFPLIQKWRVSKSCIVKDITIATMVSINSKMAGLETYNPMKRIALTLTGFH